jgi:hypothetical protein
MTKNQVYIGGSIGANASPSATGRSIGAEVDAEGGVVNPGTNQEISSGYYRTPGVPKNMLPGDQFLTSPDGNYMAVLRGRMNKMFASTRAQIICSGYHDAVRVVCENYEHLSSLGELKIETVDGRSSLAFKARIDQKSQRDEGKGMLSLDIGDKGGIFCLQVLDPGGSWNSQVQLTPAGGINLLSRDNVTTFCAQDRLEEVGGRRLSKITGNESTNVGGGRYDTIDGRWTVVVGSTGGFSYAQNLNETVMNDHFNIVSGNVTRSITGGPFATAKPTNVAWNEKILNGSVVQYAGFEIHGANPAALAGFRSYVGNGAFVFGETLPMDNKGEITKASAFCINTPSTPGSIGLGGVPPAASALLGGMSPTATNAAVKWNELAVILADLLTLLDSHIHITTVTTIGSPAKSEAAIPGPPMSGIFGAKCTPQIKGLGSTYVFMIA